MFLILKNMFTRLRVEKGQGMVEYGLLVGLISIAAIGALVLLGPQIATLFNRAKDALTNVAQ